MTRLVHDPEVFTDRLVEGFVAAHPRQVRRVSGGVVRGTGTPNGQVAVVVGGGSGHYPAFAGLVGPGLAHGAAMGNVFASPSARQVVDVARCAHRGGGVLLTYGNYAGDVLHFGQAAQRLQAAGITTETVLVTDDVASADSDHLEQRRGIAGDLVVFKIAGAAAAEGADLAEVARIARHANDRTRSFGVAFAGCTLPGADHPLFTVPDGRMSLGLGIHGEPGIGEEDIPTPEGLARLLVDRVLAERPDVSDSPDSGPVDDRGSRVTVLLNGLGTVKSEELFVVYAAVAGLLAEAGLSVVEPEVGELCTSLDMAGVSLTLTWLDEDLERLWAAPADAPGFTRGGFDRSDQLPADVSVESDQEQVPAGSQESQALAGDLLGVLEAVHAELVTHADELGDLDAIAGDGDHGIGMERGARAAVEAARTLIDAHAGAGTLLRRSGEAWSDRAGGTSGALWGVILGAAGDVLGDQESLTAEHVAHALEHASSSVQDIGRARPGDKTLVDVLVPLTEHVRDHVTDPGLAQSAARAAEDAAEATRDMTPRMGRARPLAERSIGTPDAGATSMALITRTIVDTVDATRTSKGEAHA